MPAIFTPNSVYHFHQNTSLQLKNKDTATSIPKSHNENKLKYFLSSVVQNCMNHIAINALYWITYHKP